MPLLRKHMRSRLDIPYKGTTMTAQQQARGVFYGWIIVAAVPRDGPGSVAERVVMQGLWDI